MIGILRRLGTRFDLFGGIPLVVNKIDTYTPIPLFSRGWGCFYASKSLAQIDVIFRYHGIEKRPAVLWREKGGSEDGKFQGV